MNNFDVKRDTKRMSLRGYRNTTAKRAGSNRVTISVSPEDAAVRGNMTVGLTRREAEVLRNFLNEYFEG
tara:strand:- start:1498 stop:1704 length:207 start_codon:yes stop_codon:yes gene_type:complete